ncbi:transposase [Halopseudomonas maritima]|nr:transposase [Halopseudomonas maritima]
MAQAHGQLGGFNNRIKAIKRMAYGYRNNEFLCMRIKRSYPGVL